MTLEHPIVLIIDADLSHRELMESTLKDVAEVLSVGTGAEALSAIDTKHPDIIITESQLEDINCFDLCKQLKAKLNGNCVVIFLSEPLSFEDKIIGYDAGGDDFLDKPIHPEELLKKIELNIEVKKLHSKLKAESDQSMKATMLALKQSSELGMVLRFMEKAAECKEYKTLANQLLKILSDLGLNCCVQFRDQNQAYHFNCEEDSPNATLLTMCFERGGIMDIGVNSIFNSQYSSILVNNMPISDKDRYGEIKDILSFVSNGTNSRVEGINRMKELAGKKQLSVDESIAQSGQEVKNIRELLSNHVVQVNEIQIVLKNHMETTCYSLGLNEYQETEFMEMVDANMDALENSCKDVVEIEGRFISIVDQLTSVVSDSATGAP